jgi:hypothetical protein
VKVDLEAGAIDDDSNIPPSSRSTCVLDPIIKLLELGAGRSPCSGCNNDRKTCGGEPNDWTRRRDAEIGGLP